MNQLFNSKNIKWDGNKYIELPEEDMETKVFQDDEEEDEDAFVV
jgi:hypothetical protein